MNNAINKIEISTEYHVLHDSEFPMLIVGKNMLGEYLIVSFLEENDELGVLNYFHVFAKDEVILAFLKGTISYLDVMKAASEIYLVEKSYNYSILKSEKVLFEDLTKDMLPLKSSFFPTSIPSVFNDLEKRIIERKITSSYNKIIKIKLKNLVKTNPNVVENAYKTGYTYSINKNYHRQNIQKNVYQTN
jgi:hypothetical protein